MVARLPVTEKVAGSTPVTPAVVNRHGFWSSLRLDEVKAVARDHRSCPN